MLLLNTRREINLESTKLTIKYINKKYRAPIIEFWRSIDNFNIYIYEASKKIAVVGTYYADRSNELTVFFSSDGFIDVYMSENSYPVHISVKYHYSLIDEGKIYNDWWEAKVAGEDYVLKNNKKIEIDI